MPTDSPPVLDRRFRRLCAHAGVPGATLHRLRHSVATFLVSQGKILQAQARLGHRDAATTLRGYSHALPLADGDIADAIDQQLDHRGVSGHGTDRSDNRPTGVSRERSAATAPW